MIKVLLTYEKKKNFFVNGQEFCSQDNFTLLELLYYFNYNLSLLILEYNNFICDKQNWHKISVKDQDKIEVVTIVGGG